jgi:hypothetical protein
VTDEEQPIDESEKKALLFEDMARHQTVRQRLEVRVTWVRDALYWKLVNSDNRDTRRYFRILFGYYVLRNSDVLIQ